MFSWRNKVTYILDALGVTDKHHIIIFEWTIPLTNDVQTEVERDETSRRHCKDTLCHYLIIKRTSSSQSHLICTQSVHVLINSLVHLCWVSPTRVEREVHGIQASALHKLSQNTDGATNDQIISITLLCLLWLSFVLSRLISGWIPEQNRQTEILPEAVIALIMLMCFYIESEETRGNLARHKLSDLTEISVICPLCLHDLKHCNNRLISITNCWEQKQNWL